MHRAGGRNKRTFIFALQFRKAMLGQNWGSGVHIIDSIQGIQENQTNFKCPILYGNYGVNVMEHLEDAE